LEKQALIPLILHFIASRWRSILHVFTVATSNLLIQYQFQRKTIMSNNLQKFASILTAVAINGIFCTVSFAGNHFDASTSAKSYAQATNTQTVVVKAKRLSLQQKANYDKEQINSNMQTITISAKRLSASDKVSYDKAQEKQQHLSDMIQKSMQKIA
jgi:hypothetical protein